MGRIGWRWSRLSQVLARFLPRDHRNKGMRWVLRDNDDGNMDSLM